MPKKDDLDLLLDSALATYAEPGPKSGLEDRVLAALEAARSSGERRGLFAVPRRRWLPWAIAIPVGVCLLVLWLSMGRTVHAPTTQPQLAAQPEETQKRSLSATGSEQLPAITTRPSGASKAHLNSAVASARRKSCPDTEPACEGVSSQLANIAKIVPVPKLEVFPTPQPLTGEERELLAAATSGSTAEREALAEAKKQMDAPLSIADLNIPPLTPPDEGKN